MSSAWQRPAKARLHGARPPMVKPPAAAATTPGGFHFAACDAISRTWCTADCAHGAVDEADMTELVRWRTRSEKVPNAASNYVLLFFVKAATAALKKYPFVNASLDDAAGEIVLKKTITSASPPTIYLSVVPVTQRDRMSIFDLARETAALADRARKWQALAR